MNASEINAARTALGVNQFQLGHLIGVHGQSVSNWERGIGAPAPWTCALLRALASSPSAASVYPTFEACGLAAALAVGLEHALTGAKR